MLPVVAVIGLGGGLVLVKRALLPVARGAASAERLSSQNLRQRAPVAPTSADLARPPLSRPARCIGRLCRGAAPLPGVARAAGERAGGRRAAGENRRGIVRHL